MTENTMAMDRRTYTSSLFFTALLFSILISPTTAGRRCNKPLRYLDSDGKCRKCPIQEKCKIGFTKKEPCGNGKPLQCVECREEKGFTCVEGARQSCMLCHKKNRVEEHPCTVKNQAKCGECLPGYYEDKWSKTCFDCSEDRNNREECRTTSTTRSTPTKITTTTTKTSPTTVSIKTAVHHRATMTAKQVNDKVIEAAAKTDHRALENAWPLMLALLAVFILILVVLIVMYAYKTVGKSCGRRGNSGEKAHSKHVSSLRTKALADMAVVEDETDPLTSMTTNNARERTKPSVNNQLSTGPFLVVPAGTPEELQLLMASAANSQANSAVSTPSSTPRGLHNQALSSSSSMTTVEDTTGHSDDVFSDSEATEDYNAFQGLQLRLDVEAANPTPLRSAPAIQVTPPGPVDKPKRDRSPVPSTSRDSGKFAGTQTTSFFTGRHDSLERTEDISDGPDPLVDDEHQPLTPATADEGQDTKYREKLETALKKGKDISLKDGLQSYDVVQRLAQTLDQGGVLPTDPSYQNVFQALGVPKDKIDSCHKNKTITSPTLSLLQYLESYAYRYEKHMSDLISVLHWYEFYEAVMYLCTQVMNFKPETGDMPNVEQTCES